MACQDIHITAVVKIVEAEGAFAAGFDGEIAPRDAEIIATCGINIERSGTLAEDQTSGSGTILERKVVELKDGILVKESHRAVLKLDLGTAVVRSEHIPLADGEVGLRRFPDCFLIRKRVSVSLSSKAYIALNETQANDTGMTGIGGRRMDADKTSDERQGENRTKGCAVGHMSPRWGNWLNCYKVRRKGGETGCASIAPEQWSRPVEAESSAKGSAQTLVGPQGREALDDLKRDELL